MSNLNQTYAWPAAPEGVYLHESVLVIDTETRVRYITGRQLARATRFIKRVARPRAGETSAQWTAGLVDTGLEVDALILTALFRSDEELGELHYVILDKRA